ncbi:MAG: hypothetical protein A3J55_01465 [Candidatus Ryanbacteria bacterium RIFCSPHIGHO2_02_FULL_45_17b]|nr:MAG: hypothetical protein A3J55_01465 [Candidatus Ryanbacteria bacterium RIFCSPHIGHO2_02_FULL_45_17b]
MIFFLECYNKNMKHTYTNQGNSLIIILIVLGVIIGGVLYYKGAKSEKDALEASLPSSFADTNTSPVMENASPEIGAEDTMMEAAPLKEFAVEGKNFEFSVKEIRVAKDDFVRVNFTSMDGTHDWRVSGYDVGTAVVDTGKSSSIDFKADTVGTFEFYCSVGSHRQMGMVGKLIVE